MGAFNLDSRLKGAGDLDGPVKRLDVGAILPAAKASHVNPVGIFGDPVDGFLGWEAVLRVGGVFLVAGAAADADDVGLDFRKKQFPGSRVGAMVAGLEEVDLREIVGGGEAILAIFLGVAGEKEAMLPLAEQ